MSFDLPYVFHKEYRPACGLLNSTMAENVIHLFDCDSKQPAFYLCELDKVDGGPTNKTPAVEVRISLSALLSPFNESSFVRCPKRHFTRSFLACDTLVDCWADDSPGQDYLEKWWTRYLPISSCIENSVARSPYYVCDSGTQSVPYTLVCDYRRDCHDGGDEVFCEFPPCTGDARLQCGRIKQVSESCQCSQCK